MRKLDPPAAGSRSDVALGIAARAVEFESEVSSGAATTEDFRELIPGFAGASDATAVDEDNGCGRRGAGCVSTGAGDASLDAEAPESSEAPDESCATNGGTSVGCDTRSVTGVKGVSLSLCPNQNPAEKKTPHTAAPARNNITSCPAERLFATSSEFSPRPIILPQKVHSLPSGIKLHSQHAGGNPHSHFGKAPGAGGAGGCGVSTGAKGFPRMAPNRSTGNGKTMVVLRSVPNSARV